MCSYQLILCSLSYKRHTQPILPMIVCVQVYNKIVPIYVCTLTLSVDKMYFWYLNIAAQCVLGTINESYRYWCVCVYTITIYQVCVCIITI